MTIVTNPTAGDVHVNRPLTNFSMKFLQQQSAFVALRAFPNLSVQKQSDLYYVFDKDDFMRDEAEERADGAESAGGGFTLSTDPYFARVYAFHKDVTDRQRANQDSEIGLDQSASQFVTHKLLIRRERIFANTYVRTGVWATDVVGTTDFTKWSDPSSTPIEDIRLGKRTVQLATGYRPNRMLLGREAWDTLLDNDEILSRISGGATTEIPAQVLMRLVAELFELEQILVMDAIVNPNKKGAASQDKAFIGGNNALLYYAPASAGLNEPTAGAQFSWTGLLGNTEAGLRIKRFRMEQNEADRIEGQMAFDYRVTAPEMGYYFSDVS